MTFAVQANPESSSKEQSLVLRIFLWDLWTYCDIVTGMPIEEKMNYSQHILLKKLRKCNVFQNDFHPKLLFVVLIEPGPHTC